MKGKTNSLWIGYLVAGVVVLALGVLVLLSDPRSSSGDCVPKGRLSEQPIGTLISVRGESLPEGSVKGDERHYFNAHFVDGSKLETPVLVCLMTEERNVLSRALREDILELDDRLTLDDEIVGFESGRYIGVPPSGWAHLGVTPEKLREGFTYAEPFDFAHRFEVLSISRVPLNESTEGK